jgi:formylglycine-generating enzyme required for sulfatase activity
VWNCGGLTPVGSTDAWTYNDVDGAYQQRAGCDIGRVDVHAGYVDAYEVSVARFRAWVRAGFPQPRNGSRYWTRRNDITWRQVRFREPVRSCRIGFDPGCSSSSPPDPENCTYRSTPGENDNLPVNCIGEATAYAFCWWEGKHPVTDAAWEQLATNRGTTRRPFVAGARGTFDACMFADVAGCPRTAGLPLPIDSRPLGQSIETPGVFGLWGGLREITLEHPRTPLGCLVGDDLGEWASEYGLFSLRGLSYRDTGVVAERLDHAATRQSPFRVDDTPLAAAGIRCARWDPEPTDLTE